MYRAIVFCLALFLAKASEFQKVQPKVFPRITADLSSYERQSRIVGGEDTMPNEFPYQAALFLELEADTGFCGGSLISEKYILTAAHCVWEVASIEVVLGAYNIFDVEDTQIRMKSTEFIMHADYNIKVPRYDIGLVKLPNSIVFTDAIQKVSLPSFSKADDTFESLYANFTGWGKIEDDGSISPTLLVSTVEIIENRLCNLYFFGIIKESHVCTDGYRGQTPCNGDSGGALVINGVQIGIASFGFGLGCNHLWPGAFTRITSYLEWIQENSDVMVLP
ncbi:chymotrypsin-related [Holotrichia oblita]|uniref:Chymotrypsin-related n=1 Tax=Holotrichia oblita TaxID=644536 RepID=A0ACB9TU46_HOLOL|nr:chymotrypsin-related [Holotrichia oblita]